MRLTVPLAILLAFLLVHLAPGGIAPGPGILAERAVLLEAVAFACASDPEGVCLGYNGAVPGSLLDVRQGDRLAITLVNRIAETIAPLDADPELKARLSASNVSFHVHGTSLSAAEDGILSHPGTNLIDSSVGPGQQFTYRVRTRELGTWHYHDHVLGPDGKEGIERGLYGTLVVRPFGASSPPAVLDLHLVDGKANGGRGLNAALPAGTPFELNVVVLGNHYWDVELKAPTGAVVKRLSVGTGESFALSVPNPFFGTYRWTATSVLGNAQGEVKVG